MPVLPVKNYTITSGFYRSNGAYHGGIDLAVPQGSDVFAVNSGTIRLATTDQYGGNYIDITHSDNSMTRYLHLSRMDVKKGDTVKAGQRIGLSGGLPGTTGAGLSTGPHLHFEIWDRVGGNRLDPAPYLERWSKNSPTIINPNQNEDNMFKQQLQEAIQNAPFDPETKRTLIGAIRNDGIDFNYILSFAGLAPRQALIEQKNLIEQMKRDDKIEDQEYERRISELNQLLEEQKNQPKEIVETIKTISDPSDKARIAELENQNQNLQAQLKQKVEELDLPKFFLSKFKDGSVEGVIVFLVNTLFATLALAQPERQEFWGGIALIFTGSLLPAIFGKAQRFSNKETK